MKNIQIRAFLVFAILIFASSCNLTTRNKTREVSNTTDLNIQKPIRVSPENVDAAEPSIVAAPDKTLYAVWVEHGEKGAGDLKIAHLSETGQPKGEPVRVNPNPGEVRAWSGDQPSLAVGADGRVFVGWTRNVSAGEKRGTDLCLSVSDDAGRTFSAPVRVNGDEKTAQHGMHSLAVAPDGRIIVTWLDERNLHHMPAGDQVGSRPENGFEAQTIALNTEEKAEPEMEMEPNSEIFTAFSTDGGKTFSPNRLISKDTCPCCKTDLAIASDGQIFVAWRQVVGDNFRHIAVASSVDGGESFSKPVIVSDDQWQIMGCPVSGASLSITKDDILRVVWFTSGKAGEPGYYFAESKDSGNTFSKRKKVAPASNPGTPSLNINADSGFVIWQGAKDGKTAVLIALLDPSKNELLSEPVSIAGAQLPSAAQTERAANVLYIAREDGGKRGIWLARVERDD